MTDFRGLRCDDDVDLPGDAADVALFMLLPAEENIEPRPLIIDILTEARDDAAETRGTMLDL